MKPDRRALAIYAALVMVVAGCGTRVSDERLKAAAFLGETKTETSVSNVAGPGAAGTAAAGPTSSTDDSLGADQSTTTGPIERPVVSNAGSGGSARSGTTGPAAGARPGTSNLGGAAESTTTSLVAGPTGAATGRSSSVGTASSAGPATGSEVPLGVLGTFSGPVGAYVKDFATAAQVWAKWVNDRGGLNNHRVRVVVADDGGSPATFNSKAQQLVEQEHVVAFIFTTLALAPAGNNAYLNSVKVPTFGTEGGLDQSYENPYVLTAVPAGSVYAQAMMRGFAKVARPQGASKLGIIACTDFSLCDVFDRVFSDPGEQRAAGFQAVYRTRTSLTTPDFTSICIDARSAGAVALLNVLDTASLNRLVDACSRQGYHPLIGLADLLARPELANNPNANGAAVGTKSATWVDTRVPGVVEMLGAFKQYAPGTVVNGTHAGGWLAAKFLEATAASLPAGSPTSADFMAGLAGLNGTTLGGLTYPLHFTPGQPSPKVLCYAAAVVSNKRFVPAPGEPLDCA